MYTITTSDRGQLTIRSIPWLQQAIGWLFMLAGWAILILVFPTQVRLHCDRKHDLCTFERSNLVRTETSTWPSSDLKGARLEVLDSWNSGTTFVIWLQTSDGSVAFTPYSIGGSRDAKQALVAMINVFSFDPAQPVLEAVEDERRLFYPVAAGLILFGLLPVVFVKTATCRLDLLQNRFVLTNSGLWGRTTVERRLSDVMEAQLDGISQAGTTMCRVTFRLRSGEKIPLTYYRYHNCQKANEIVHTINEILNRR